MKNNHRFSLFIDNITQELFIMVNPGIISEILMKDNNGEWVEGYFMQIGLERIRSKICGFNKWKDEKSFTIDNEKDNVHIKLGVDDVIKMKQAIMRKDKRIKMNIT